MPEDQYPPQTGSGVYPGFADPDWQRRAEQQQIEIYKRAKNIQQAEADVSAARRMLGIMKADREVQSGVPVDQAMFNNLHYFTSPRDKGFADTVQQLRPLKAPYATNFPGMTAPVVIAPTRSGQTVHFPTAAVLPQTNVEPVVRDFPGVGKGVYNPKTGTMHFAPREVSIERTIDNAAIKEAQKIVSSPYTTRKQKTEAQSALDKLQQKYSKPSAPPMPSSTTPPATPKVLARPSSKADLVKGGLYQTSKGLAEWDGEKFIPR